MTITLQTNQTIRNWGRYWKQ